MPAYRLPVLIVEDNPSKANDDLDEQNGDDTRTLKSKPPETGGKMSRIPSAGRQSDADRGGRLVPRHTSARGITGITAIRLSALDGV